mmetsp:Transcript_47896/g.113368  ORF Transcript_47896/g.113368 Transcript_47896/m.113368 type:complete len:224 (+) Transcript_47896:424-1095(+)
MARCVLAHVAWRRVWRIVGKRRHDSRLVTGARGASAAAEAAGRERRARAAPPLSRRLGPPRPALLLLLRAFCWRSSPLRPLVRVGGCRCGWARWAEGQGIGRASRKAARCGRCSRCQPRVLQLPAPRRSRLRPDGREARRGGARHSQGHAHPHARAPLRLCQPPLLPRQALAGGDRALHLRRRPPHRHRHALALDGGAAGSSRNARERGPRAGHGRQTVRARA